MNQWYKEVPLVWHSTVWTENLQSSGPFSFSIIKRFCGTCDKIRFGGFSALIIPPPQQNALRSCWRGILPYGGPLFSIFGGCKFCRNSSRYHQKHQSHWYDNTGCTPHRWITWHQVSFCTSLIYCIMGLVGCSGGNWTCALFTLLWSHHIHFAIFL
jgi:hypothetical protein